MVNFVIALECFGICLTIVALLLLLNGEGAREQKLLIMILCGSLVQNVGYLLELIAPTVEAAMTAVIVEKVGSAFTPLCYCWFIYILSISCSFSLVCFRFLYILYFAIVSYYIYYSKLIYRFIHAYFSDY